MAKGRSATMEEGSGSPPSGGSARKVAMAELFGLEPKHGLGSHPKSPQPIMLTVLPPPSDPDVAALIPEPDPYHVFEPEITKAVMMGLELGMTTYVFGPAGTGKTTLFLEVCARTHRPVMRVQHTETTEEAHIVGQWTVRDGSTHFQLGPLAAAMVMGAAYLADEFDFGMPSVMAVYHPVMEGHPLVIKDAPPELRVIRPHRDFRFLGTGNTNGTGDATGLYQGTRLQNAALYSRWQITEQLGYMDAATEARIVTNRAGVSAATASQLVDFAAAVREGHAAQTIGSTIGPRELISAATIGKLRGGNYRSGLASAFSNRLTAIDKEAVDQVAQRIFG